MDQHPIPQDVTGFQFKLIGSMTVKQFAYVASGVISAVILFYLPLNTPLSPLIKFFLIPILGASGAIIAFVPIDGRPIDVMAGNFVKAVFSPNQYIYHKQPRKLSFSSIPDAKAVTVKKGEKPEDVKPSTPLHIKQSIDKQTQLHAILHGAQLKKNSDLDKKESAFLNTLNIHHDAAQNVSVAIPTSAKVPGTLPQLPMTPSHTQAPVLQQQPQTPIIPHAAIPTPTTLPAPQMQKENTKQSLEIKEFQLEQQLEKAKKEELTDTTTTGTNAAHQKVMSLEQQINDIHKQKMQLDDELSKLQSQLTVQKTPLPPAPAQAASPIPPVPTLPSAPVQDPMHVRTIPQDVSKKAGLPRVSDTPNVIVGIVKDPRGNVLSNILVEVKDTAGNPVRAFKTNALGQFASATPLATGTYTMELEDPKKQHRFDVIKIIANNTIMLPIEVISHDAREELRQQLFAN